MKPPSRRDIPSVRGVRPLEDDEVDRAEVEVRRRTELTAANRSRACPGGHAGGGAERERSGTDEIQYVVFRVCAGNRFIKNYLDRSERAIYNR